MYRNWKYIFYDNKNNTNRITTITHQIKYMPMRFKAQNWKYLLNIMALWVSFYFRKNITSVGIISEEVWHLGRILKLYLHLA